RAERWRVVAFTFDGATDLSARVARTIPSRLREFGPILTALKDEGVSAAVLVGRFSMTDVLHTRTSTADETALSLQGRAGSRIDSRLVDAIIALFAGVGVGVLDQRRFLGDLVPEAGCWSRRAPTADEWTEIRRGLALAREIADASIGQTIVLRYGAVVAVEAVEGTTEAVRRGTALAGPGAGRGPAQARAGGAAVRDGRRAHGVGRRGAARRCARHGGRRVHRGGATVAAPPPHAGRAPQGVALPASRRPRDDRLSRIQSPPRR